MKNKIGGILLCRDKRSEVLDIPRDKSEQKMQIDDQVFVFEENALVPLMQGSGTNHLSRLNTIRKKPQWDRETKIATLSIDGMTVELKDWESTQVFKPNVQKLLDTLLILLTNRQSPYQIDGVNVRVHLPLKEYLDILGKPQTESSFDELRENLKSDILPLYHASVTFSQKWGKGYRQYGQMRIISKWEIKDNVLTVDFAPALVEYLKKSFLMQYPVGLLKLDNRDPVALMLGRKLALHFSMYSNQRSATHNIISVRTLLDWCEMIIPSEEQIKETTQEYKRYIIIPLERALNALQDSGIINWEYCNSKKSPLTKEQIQRAKDHCYKVISELYICFEILNYTEIPKLEKSTNL